MNLLKDVNLEKSEEVEYCVLCNKETNVLKTTHISLRECYVEGAGQLCKNCYYKKN